MAALHTPPTLVVLLLVVLLLTGLVERALVERGSKGAVGVP